MMDKNTLTIAIGFFALIFLIWNFTISAKIMDYLKKRGEKVSLATMHFKIFDNAGKYKKLTLAESGEVGKHYNPFLVTFVIFAIFLLVGIILVAG
ncbi:MAG: hypothetical protein HQ522_10565 [Bacteroidetes bacterium]|nr:hypothetical protein [Bacteroidota bacterium]